MELAFCDGTFAEEHGGGRGPASQVIGEGEADGDGKSAADDRVAPEEAMADVEQVHRASAAPEAAPFDANPNISAMIARACRDPAGEGVTVLTVGGDDVVVGLQAIHHTDRDGLLTDVEVQEAADL